MHPRNKMYQEHPIIQEEATVLHILESGVLVQRITDECWQHFSCLKKYLKICLYISLNHISPCSPKSNGPWSTTSHDLSQCLNLFYLLGSSWMSSDLKPHPSLQFNCDTLFTRPEQVSSVCPEGSFTSYIFLQQGT